MNILIACEESQRICIEYRKLGHRAFSCDIQKCSGGHPEWHILGDAIPYINGDCHFWTQDGKEHWQTGEWDILIAHPPCTYLAVVGNKYFDVDKYGDKAVERIQKREEAYEFFMKFINAKCKRIAVENPKGFVNTRYRDPDIVIHPYQFGDPVYKQTCFWLKNLPQLKPTNVVKPEKTDDPHDYMGNLYYAMDDEGNILRWNDPRTAIERSKTFPGIAKAIATQWNNLPPLVSDITYRAPNRMNVLIVCEESQTACKAFRAKGHRAFSCDLQVCSGGYPEWHILGNALDYLDGDCKFTTEDGKEHEQIGQWDLIIAHPPCTYLARSGAGRMFRKEERYEPSFGTFQMVNVERLKGGMLGRDFFMRCYNARCDRIAVENPVPMSIYMLPEFTQTIEPYYFGDPVKKLTCLWLKGLPKLEPTNIVEPTMSWVSGGNKKADGTPRKLKAATCRKKRFKSRSFEGICQAMADQWGSSNE